MPDATQELAGFGAASPMSARLLRLVVGSERAPSLAFAASESVPERLQEPDVVQGAE